MVASSANDNKARGNHNYESKGQKRQMKKPYQTSSRVYNKDMEEETKSTHTKTLKSKESKSDTKVNNEKLLTMKRLEKEKKAKEKKQKEQLKEKSRPHKKAKSGKNIDWTKGYENGRYNDDDEEYTIYL